jgi:hypothetical protein
MFSTLTPLHEPFTVQFDEYQSEHTITYCMQNFGASQSVTWPGDDEGNKIPNDEKWELSGCFDLRTYDRQK